MKRGICPEGRVWFTAIAVLVILLGCREEKNTPAKDTADAADRTGATVAVAPSMEQVANATYQGLRDQPVTLRDGRWEGEPFVENGASRPSVSLESDFRLTADLNRDGTKEAVVLLTEESGGSGRFEYLAVLGRRDGSLVTLGTAFVGDRVQIRGFRTDADRIVLDVVQQSAEDEACCPSQKATRAWSLGRNGLVEDPPQITGQSFLTDLRGIEWVLTRLGPEEPAPAQPEITLVFNDSGAAGKSACNTYAAQVIFVVHDSPGGFTLGAIATTKKACPGEVMALEENYLERLGAARRWSYHVGKLAITWETDDGSGVLVYTRR